MNEPKWIKNDDESYTAIVGELGFHVGVLKSAKMIAMTITLYTDDEVISAIADPTDIFEIIFAKLDEVTKQ